MKNPSKDGLRLHPYWANRSISGCFYTITSSTGSSITKPVPEKWVSITRLANPFFLHLENSDEGIGIIAEGKDDLSGDSHSYILAIPTCGASVEMTPALNVTFVHIRKGYAELQEIEKKIKDKKESEREDVIAALKSAVPTRKAIAIHNSTCSFNVAKDWQIHSVCGQTFWNTIKGGSPNESPWEVPELQKISIFKQAIMSFSYGACREILCEGKLENLNYYENYLAMADVIKHFEKA